MFCRFIFFPKPTLHREFGSLPVLHKVTKVWILFLTNTIPNLNILFSLLLADEFLSRSWSPTPKSYFWCQKYFPKVSNFSSAGTKREKLAQIKDGFKMQTEKGGKFRK